MPDTTPAVSLRGAGRRYGERLALRDVSLDLQAGQTLVVFGPNGAGKTTLLRMLATLLRPHAGEVRVFGRALFVGLWPPTFWLIGDSIKHHE